MPHALARHDALARRTVERHRGTVVKMTGDGLYAAFEDPLDAVGATIELQQVLDDPAATEGIALRVRCGMHAGVVERRDNDYFGSSVNRAARIMGTAHGGQVVLSQTVADLVRDRLPGDVSLRDLGSVRLRDLANPERVYQIVHPRLRQDFPALRSLEATPNNLPPQADDVRRARARGRRCQRGAARHAAAHADRRRRHRQDAPVAAGRGRRAGRIPRRRLVRRAGAARRRPPGRRRRSRRRSASGGDGASGDRSAAGSRGRPAAAAGAGQLRAPRRRLRDAGRPIAAGRPAACGSWPPAASRCASRARRPSRCRR